MVRRRERLLAVLVGTVLLGGAGSEISSGRAIYETGTGSDRIAITIGEPPVPAASTDFACARCHGALGTGGSEGGIAAPPLTAAAALPEPEARAWLSQALRDGRVGDRRLLSAMPRYALSARDLAALSGFVRTLPYPAMAGLSARSITIGMDLRNSPFTDAERAILIERFGATLAGINRRGGLFGRTVELAAEKQEAFIALAWSADSTSGTPHLSVVPPRPPADADCPTCCGSLHAGLGRQLEWLLAYLGSASSKVAYSGSLAGILAPVSGKHPGPPDAMIHLGMPAELGSSGKHVGRDTPIYAFADLGTARFAAAARAPSYLVSGVDLRAQMIEVETLQARDRRFSASPRLASAAIELDRGAALIGEAFSQAGRRVAPASVCDALRRAAEAAQRESILSVADGRVLDRTNAEQP